jgi:hypothetical protein
MATAGVTHDVTLNNQGFMLAQLKSGSNYVRESMPGYQTAAAAISTDGTESLDSPDGYGFPASKVHRVYFDEWRGRGRHFLTGGATGKPSLSGPRGSSIDADRTTGGPGGLVAEMFNLRSLMGGSGFGPVPQSVDFATGGVASDFGAIEFNGDLYVVQDGVIYTATVDGVSNFVSLTATGGALPSITSLGYDVLGQAWVCFGTVPRKVDNVASSYPIAGPTDYMLSYAGVTIRGYNVPATNRSTVYIDSASATLHQFNFTSYIRGMCVHDGAVWFGCDGGLYRLHGVLRASNPTAAPNVLDMFEYSLQLVIAHSDSAQNALGLHNWRSLTSFDGALWGALDGKLVKVAVKGGGFNFQVEQQPTPPGWVWSIAVAAGMMFVSLQSGVSDAISTSLYVYDPAVGGWWALNDDHQNTTYLFSGGGVVRDGRLMSCHDQEATISRWGFDATNPSGFNVYNFRTAGDEQWAWDDSYVMLPLITPDDLARESGLGAGKQGLIKLLKVGVEWDTFSGGGGAALDWAGWPDVANAAGLGNLYLTCQVSLDDAYTFTSLNNAMGSPLYFLQSGVDDYKGRTDWLLPVGAQIIKPVSQIGQGAPAETDQNGNGWLFKLGVVGAPMPLFRRFFIDYQVLEFNPQIGNRWKLALDLSYAPDAVRLDGQAQDVPAPINFFGHIYTQADAVALTLAEYWSSGTALNFGDINGQDGHNVKIVSYKIERAAPGRFPALASDGGTLQQNYIMWIELVEVIE